MTDLSINARLALADEYKAKGELHLAVKVVYEGLNLDPDNVELLKYIATLHMASKNYGLTVQLLKRAKELSPADPTIEHNIGLAIMNMAPISNREEFLDDAERRLKKALQKYPFWQSHSGLAQIALSRGEWDSCISHANKAIELNDSSDTSINQTMGFAYLAKGLFAAGWEQVEKHIGGEMRKPKPFNKEKYWDGQVSRSDSDFSIATAGVISIGGRKTRLFVQGEQGLGDEISFASVFPDAAKEMDLTVECDPRLEGLFKRSFPQIDIHGSRTSVRDPRKPGLEAERAVRRDVPLRDVGQAIPPQGRRLSEDGFSQGRSGKTTSMEKPSRLPSGKEGRHRLEWRCADELQGAEKHEAGRSPVSPEDAGDYVGFTGIQGPHR
jgi:Flp pilus assembly protein TadD, contains TPR repeats